MLPVRFGGVGVGFVLGCVGLSPVALLHSDCAGPGSRLLSVRNKTAAFRVAINHALRMFPCHFNQLPGARRRNSKRLSDIIRRGKSSANFDRLWHWNNYTVWQNPRTASG